MFAHIHTDNLNASEITETALLYKQTRSRSQEFAFHVNML